MLALALLLVAVQQVLMSVRPLAVVQQVLAQAQLLVSVRRSVSVRRLVPAAQVRPLPVAAQLVELATQPVGRCQATGM